MANFNIAYSKTSALEGPGLTDLKTDRGGQTFAGISRKHHPDWEGWKFIDAGDMVSAARLVKPFYEAEFWKPLLLDQVLEQSVADEIFDTAVNCGKPKAVKILQGALKLLRQDITVDGVMGYKTLSILNGYKHIKSLLKVMNGLQFVHYTEVVKIYPDQIANFRGWMERV